MNSDIQVIQLDGSSQVKRVAIDKFVMTEHLTWVIMSPGQVKLFLAMVAPVPELVRHVLVAKEARPRAMVFDDSLVASFRGVHVDKDASFEMASIRVWIRRNLIVTVHRKSLNTVSEIRRRVELGVGPTREGDFLQLLLSLQAESSAEVVEQLGVELDMLEANIDAPWRGQENGGLGDSRKRGILLQRYLVPQREAVIKLLNERLSWVMAADVAHLHEAVESYTRVLENLRAERERAIIMQEELLTQMQNAINQKMYFLSVITAVFLPLGFIVGLLGINVHGIPGADFKYGFEAVCCILVMVVVIQLYFLKKKGWF